MGVCHGQVPAGDDVMSKRLLFYCTPPESVRYVSGQDAGNDRFTQLISHRLNLSSLIIEECFAVTFQGLIDPGLI